MTKALKNCSKNGFGYAKISDITGLAYMCDKEKHFLDFEKNNSDKI